MALDRIRLQNGCVITVDKAPGNFRRADVRIEGTKIAAVGPDLGVTDAEIIHRHLWEGMLRNISADGILASYFPDVLGVLAPVYRPEDACAGDLISALGAIDAGVTTILDWSHIQNTPEHADAVIQVLRESGIRAVFAYGNPNTSLADWWFNSSLKHPEDIRRLRTQYFSSDDQLRTLAPRGPEFTTVEVVRHDWALAREVGAPVTVHVGVGENGFSVRSEFARPRYHVYPLLHVKRRGIAVHRGHWWGLLHCDRRRNADVIGFSDLVPGPG